MTGYLLLTKTRFSMSWEITLHQEQIALALFTQLFVKLKQ